MKNFILFLLPVLLILQSKVFTQNTTMTIADITTCSNTEVLIPLEVQELLNVGAMTLFISFDSTAMTFMSLQNIHPAFSGMLYNVIYSPPPTRIGISYTNMNGTNLPSGKLFDIKFMFKDGQTNLHFMTSCDLTTPNFENIQVTYNDGSAQHHIQITQQPINQTVHQPGPAFFNVTAQGDHTYQWQQSHNNGASWSNVSNSASFQGVTTAQLEVVSTNTLFSGRLFRCMMNFEGCIKYSDHAKLTVLPPLYDQQISLPAGWSSLSSYLNPIDTDLDDFFAEVSDELIILITGSVMYYPDQGINTILSFNPKAGYSIKMAEAATLTIPGYFQTDKTIELPVGWSYLPVLSNCHVSIQALFGGNLSQVVMIKEIAGSNVFWPDMNISTLENLSPGRAYMINMSTSLTITFPACN